MRKRPVVESVSDTARWVAYYRALESERPDSIFRDPFARRLAGERGRSMAESLPTLSLDWVIPVRTRVYDELILETVGEGRASVVLNLAAGLDTRPYRLPIPKSLRWIEVDLPDLLGMKAEALVNEEPSCSLERVSLDLADRGARRALLDRLARDGVPVLVVTEGLLAYLDDATVASLAADLHACPSVRSWILEAPMPEVLVRARRSWGKTLVPAGAEMKFAPASGVDFFLAHGWEPRLTRSLTHEARRLGREMRFAAVARALSTLTARGRERWKKIVMYAVMEKQERDRR
jgi:methyltransferase (TIGR00027 family)